MFTPKYTITNKLLANITRVNDLIHTLNTQRFPQVILFEFEKAARETSSYASTSIEGNPLPLTEVKKILTSTPANIRDSEKEVLNYNQALQELNAQLKKKNFSFSLELILHIQEQVIHGLLSSIDTGTLRHRPVVVNDPRTGNTVYLPPDVNEVMPLMEELIAFVRTNTGVVDPLILAGIFHKQMVIIHPFMDGNGRTTRLATKALLAHMGLNTFNLFSFENYYNQNVTKYFQTVGEFGNYYDRVEKIDFTVWLEYFTDGLIDELLRVQKLLRKTGINPGAELKPYHLKILDAIKEKGFINDNNYAKLVRRAKATRALDFRKLLNLGLIERKEKGRATYYILKENQNEP
jgi:Fic family protein